MYSVTLGGVLTKERPTTEGTASYSHTPLYQGDHCSNNLVLIEIKQRLEEQRDGLYIERVGRQRVAHIVASPQLTTVLNTVVTIL